MKYEKECNRFFVGAIGQSPSIGQLPIISYSIAGSRDVDNKSKQNKRRAKARLFLYI